MMKTITEELIQKFEPISSEAIQKAFNKKLTDFGIENITVESVLVDYDGDITITFVDDEDGELDIIFVYDQDEGAMAMVFDDPDSEEFIVIDLDSLSPSIKSTPFGMYINLTELDWLSGSVLQTILQSATYLEDSSDPAGVSPSRVKDKYGWVTDESLGESFIIDEEILEDFELDESGRKISVIRGGKRVRLPVVRKIRKKVLSGKQRAAVRKGVRKRKLVQSRINRKRKRSLKVRKRVGVKTPKLTRFQKAAGTANARKL